MPLTDKLERAAKLKSELATLQKEVEEETKQEMLTLHTKFGYASAQDFLEALAELIGSRTPKRKYVRLKGEMRVRVVAALKDPRAISMDIARQENIELETVEKLRRKLIKLKVIPPRP